MDLFDITGMILRRDPKLTRDDVFFFLSCAGFLFVAILLTIVTYWTGDMPTFLRLIFSK